MNQEDDAIRIKLKKYMAAGGLDESVDEFLAKLTAREVKILRTRFGFNSEQQQSLEDLVNNFDVSRERIKEIEERALRKLRGRDPYDDGPDVA
jgi:DNA-directed RNA polymerase sigma subunit (sigma70/sigma32)